MPLGLAGCSGGTTGLAAADATDLHGRVAAMRAAAVLDNPDAARTALAQFRADVASLLERGQLTPDQAVALLGHADAVAVQISSEVRPPTPAPTPRPHVVTKAQPKPRKQTVARTPDRDELSSFWTLLRGRIAQRLKDQAREHRRDRDRDRGRDERGRA
ncbi:hypothetical protein GCM10009547_45040 [Sporichthya brevicatena]|uniref:Uncharacterized protein n=1 Tax=Sporichthya brevicatena TaxID=171442 RepID=A0ABN1HAX2_9ACTN